MNTQIEPTTEQNGSNEAHNISTEPDTGKGGNITLTRVEKLIPP